MRLGKGAQITARIILGIKIIKYIWKNAEPIQVNIHSFFNIAVAVDTGRAAGWQVN